MIPKPHSLILKTHNVIPKSHNVTIKPHQVILKPNNVIVKHAKNIKHHDILSIQGRKGVSYFCKNSCTTLFQVAMRNKILFLLFYQKLGFGQSGKNRNQN